MLSLGIEASLAFWMARASAGLPSGSPPPSFAATVMARASLVKSLPPRASTIAFLCLIPAHLECPAMRSSLLPELMGTRPRLPGFEALRGLAALAVVVYHAIYQPSLVTSEENWLWRYG